MSLDQSVSFRYCAVCGGVYCLHRYIDAFTLSEPNGGKVSGIVCSNGQKIVCRYVGRADSAFSHKLICQLTRNIVCNASTMKSTLGIQPNVR